MVDYYTQVLLDEASAPHGWRVWDSAGQARCHNASCGDWLTVQARVENGLVTEAIWHGEGCTLSRAAASLVSRSVLNMPVSEIQKMDFESVKKILNLESISPGRIKCVLLFLTCLQTQLKNQSEPEKPQNRTAEEESV